MREQEPIIIARGDRLSRLLLDALFNRFRLDAFRLACGNEDTVFLYAIHTKARLTKARRTEITNYAIGFAECWRMLG